MEKTWQLIAVCRTERTLSHSLSLSAGTQSTVLEKRYSRRDSTVGLFEDF